MVGKKLYHFQMLAWYSIHSHLYVYLHWAKRALRNPPTPLYLPNKILYTRSAVEETQAASTVETNRLLTIFKYNNNILFFCFPFYIVVINEADSRV